MRIDDHKFDPAKVACTLRYRGLGAPPGGLFRLYEDGAKVILEGPGENVDFTPADLDGVEPDPLWESADGICSHMEEDHGDTFFHFLRWRGREVKAGTEVRMPWVDKDGFVLAVCGSRSEFVWVPFPEPCVNPNLVRKSMITMLREIRP